MIIIHDKLLEYGGAEYVLSEMIKGLKPIYVFTPCVNDKDLWEERFGCKIKTLNILRFINNQSRYRIFYPLAALILTIIKINGGANTCLYYSSSLGKYVKFKKAKKCILYSNYPFKGILRTDDYLIGRSFIIRLLVRLLVTPMKYLESLSLRKFSKISVIYQQAQIADQTAFALDNIQVINCPVNTKKLKLIPEKKGLGKIRALIICRLYKEKKVEDVLATLTRQSSIILTVIGGGPMLTEYRKRYPTVRFLDFVSDSEKFEELQQTDFLINPTSQEWSLTTVEANCGGIPAVSAECDAILEINQIITSRRDQPNKLFDANSRSLIVAIGQLRNISRGERLRALEHFSPEEFVKRMKGLVNE